ncbi:MAG: molybdopterin-guanine dinucleotide biosynthesis protein B [Deltaproteobacteria bacterium]|nr:molybdopterin-guanine dinucleotide biosynthesis protein B [Deltaproteobacteria bacterium]
MKLVHIVGRQGQGKTTLVVDLIRELSGRGVRVGSIKHSSHAHELDIPGKDSQVHRLAGSNPAAVIAENLVGVFMAPATDGDEYARLAPLYSDCEIVIVEGDIGGSGPKVEVWRAEVSPTPLAAERGDIVALVTDDATDLALPRFSRADLRGIADFVLSLAART